jgi:hypothetical protein
MRLRAPLIAFVLLTAGCGSVQENSRPACDSSASLRLMSAAVPSAAYVPCVRSLPVGWRFGGMRIEDGRADFALRSKVATIRVDLSDRCNVTNMTEQSSDEHAARFYRSQRRKTLVEVGAYVFDGGCARYVLDSQSRPRLLVVDLLKEGISLRRAPSPDRGQGNEL